MKRLRIETGVFGHMACDNFRFTFGHIERSAIRFHETGYKKQMNAVAPHGAKTNQRGTKPNVYPACA